MTSRVKEALIIQGIAGLLKEDPYHQSRTKIASNASFDQFVAKL
jgi:hypothetical protein